MNPMQNYFNTNRQFNQQPAPLPQPPEPKCRFRWPIYVGLPLVLLAFFWLIKGIEPSFSIEDFLDHIDIENQSRFVRLMLLCVVCIAITLIVKSLRNKLD